MGGLQFDFCSVFRYDVDEVMWYIVLYNRFYEWTRISQNEQSWNISRKRKKRRTTNCPHRRQFLEFVEISCGGV